MIRPSLVEKIGWYTVGDSVYYAKSQALTAARNNAKLVQYHFNDAVLAALDYTVDPAPGSHIDDLYKHRAQQLRDRYDYLVLLYSGGPDSTNILLNFVENNIPIDEIVNINSYSASGVWQNTIHNADYIKNVEPFLQATLKQSSFKSKITVLDEIEICKRHIDFYRSMDHSEILIDGGSISTFAYRPYVLRYLPEAWSRLINGQRVGLIVGSDKPRIMVKNNRWVTNWHDALSGNFGLTALTDPVFGLYDGWEWFYNSPDAVIIMQKQLHVLKSFMTSNQQLEFYTTQEGTKYNDQQIAGSRSQYTCESKFLLGMHLNYHTFHKLIYPKVKPQYVTHKSTSGLIKPDMFWFEKIKNNDASYLEYAIKKWLHNNVNLLANTVSDQRGSWPVLSSKDIYID